MTSTTDEVMSAVNLAVVDDLAQETGCDVVMTSIKGGRVMLAFEPDPYEHPRRCENSVGAVLSRRLLHASGPYPRHTLADSRADELDVATLTSEGLAALDTRRRPGCQALQPPDASVALPFKARGLERGPPRAGGFPPTFLRYAIGVRRSMTDAEAITAAVSLGIGARVMGPTRLVVHAESELRERGVPGIYRWWLAEVAYDAWLRQMPTE